MVDVLMFTLTQVRVEQFIGLDQGSDDMVERTRRHPVHRRGSFGVDAILPSSARHIRKMMRKQTLRGSFECKFGPIKPPIQPNCSGSNPLCLHPCSAFRVHRPTILGKRRIQKPGGRIDALVQNAVEQRSHLRPYRTPVEPRELIQQPNPLSEVPGFGNGASTGADGSQIVFEELEQLARFL